MDWGSIVFCSISIHAPARGATSATTYIQPNAAISIHAPARGATEDSDFIYFPVGISIHAPARGATSALSKRADTWTFQSTLPRGERPDLLGHSEIATTISIHAPARGATSFAIIYTQPECEISIHAPARGATSVYGIIGRRWQISIHAPARGATVPPRCGWTHLSHFNPRSREGSDQYRIHFHHFHLPFQSTLPRGERP